METNLQQFVEIAGGVLPLMVLGAAGYEPLGGCTCGCGIGCAAQAGMPFARWVCPDDVGYSCSGEVESTLLFAREPDAPPCATQSVAVLWLINLFMMGLPGVLGLLAAFFARSQLITEAHHRSIREQLADTSGKPRVDPLSGERIRLPTNSERDLLLEHWSVSELAHVRAGGLRRLRRVVGARLGLWTALLVGLLVAMATSGSEYVVTLGCLVLAVVFVLLPWDAVRVRLLFSARAHSLTSLQEFTGIVHGDAASTCTSTSSGGAAVELAGAHVSLSESDSVGAVRIVS